MDSYLTWGVLSALLIFISGLQYMWGIYTKKVERPVLSTWGIWTLLSLLFLLTYADAGAQMETTLPAAIVGFTNPLIIFLLAIRYGQKGWNSIDSWCVATSILTIVFWQASDSPIVGLFGAVVADTIAAIPQIQKSWTDPDDEPWFPWATFCAGSAVNMLGLESWGLEYSLYPIYMTTASFIICLPIIWRRLVLKARQTA